MAMSSKGDDLFGFSFFLTLCSSQRCYGFSRLECIPLLKTFFTEVYIHTTKPLTYCDARWIFPLSSSVPSSIECPAAIMKKHA